ncbi:MAG: nucleoside-triphosphatase [Anaerolineae bacterium]
MGKSLLLTGYPGIGKTTIVRHVIDALDSDALGGFYTAEIRGPGGRKGFKLVTLDGKETVLAHKDFRDPKAPRVGRYGVDVAAFERVGVAALQRAMDEGKLVVVDEIGKMELFSQLFQETLMRAFLGPHHVLGTITGKPHPAADVFRYLAQVEIWEVDRRNRDTMPARVLKWLAKEIALG